MKRLDVYLYDKKLFPTREKAKEAILSGIISVNNKICTKPGTKVDEFCKVEIMGQVLKYVSRAGLKLEKAINFWNLDFENKIVLDVGASTGGFTDCALQFGAKKVFSVDVGTNQLHEKLKLNPKVVNLEKTDFRNLKNFEQEIDICVCDCSFISLKLLSSQFSNFLTKNKILIVLIKPQFECGLALAKKYKGVIKDATLYDKIKKDIILDFESKNLKFIDCCESPIKGTSGNTEFLAYFIKK